ncbi:hypothetical protein BD833_12518 [Blastococcus xanthinilyticus]|uniref:Uncharacterized protein n=1 Tax=Blastococcus xanthinilyticus TaxID=1564164 RepID=A0A5S5CPC1_9ACTN|nr:hypothetical protein BD833_12518 [Blastococcus xanthinilyticus]
MQMYVVRANWLADAFVDEQEGAWELVVHVVAVFMTIHRRQGSRCPGSVSVRPSTSSGDVSGRLTSDAGEWGRMNDEDAHEPRLFSKRWWTQTNPYWGEWRSGPWGWFYSALVVLLLVGMAYLFDTTAEGWITVAVMLAVVLAVSITARPGRRRDDARLRRHQAGAPDDVNPEG